MIGFGRNNFPTTYLELQIKTLSSLKNAIDTFVSFITCIFRISTFADG